MMLTAPVSSVPCFQSPTASARYGPWPASRAAAPSGCRSGQWESLRTGRCLLGTACRLPALRFPPGTARCSGLALHFLCSSSGLSHFSKRSVPASERDTEKPTSRRRGQRCAAAPGVSLRLDRPQARARARVSVCAHVHTYACSRIHPHTHLKPVRPDTADPNPTPELYASVLLSASAMSTSEREEAAPHYA